VTSCGNGHCLCPLRILYVLRHAWNRHISVRQDSGDAGAQQASPILSYSRSAWPFTQEEKVPMQLNSLLMLCLITYRRLAQGIRYHRFLLFCHPLVLPSLIAFLFNLQNIKYTQALLHCTLHKISFPTSLYLPKSDSEQECYVCFTSANKSVTKFKNAQRPMFSQ
jgi:hypothetical protein